MRAFLGKIRQRRLWRLAETVNGLESRFTDADLPAEYLELRRRRRKGDSLNALLPEAFALVREASRRTIGIRQYDVQVAGAAGLASGYVAEMNTGEGKTFVAPLVACLYALDQNGVHVLTANDYLAGRDAALLGPVYEALGLKAGVVLADTPGRDRARAYEADVTYATVPQLGFDFLRQYFEQAPDALRTRDMWQYLRSEIDGSTREKRCLRGRYFAVLDEVDSILIDYARSPLSISVEADTQRSPEVYARARQFALELQEGADYTLDRVKRHVELTNKGKRKLPGLQEEYDYLRLMDSEWEERVTEAIRAEELMRRGDHYVVQNGQVLLVDQTSGRLLIGQRLGGEAHQALEAKEGMEIRPRQSVAKKITIQSLMRPYQHLAGMTGTAWEARREFSGVYGMGTVRFAPRLKLHRHMRPQRTFAEDGARWEAVVEDIAREHERGRPVLVGTRSVERSRLLASMLEERGVSHQVLNAVDHAREAEIIAGAGERGAVTVATNMAGRGVEFKLGEGVEEIGGMHVVGTERHLLSRVDRQLAGRCGRRGQPGTVQFFASLEDELLLALPDRRLKRLRRRHSRRGETTGRRLERTFATAQETYAARFAQIRRALLVQDLAQEEADKILFGQQNL